MRITQSTNTALETDWFSITWDPLATCELPEEMRLALDTSVGKTKRDRPKSKKLSGKPSDTCREQSGRALARASLQWVPSSTPASPYTERGRLTVCVILKVV